MGFCNKRRSGFKAPHRFKVKADVHIEPEEYKLYFEDLMCAPNEEIEPVGCLETVS